MIKRTLLFAAIALAFFACPGGPDEHDITPSSSSDLGSAVPSSSSFVPSSSSLAQSSSSVETGSSSSNLSSSSEELSSSSEEELSSSSEASSSSLAQSSSSAEVQKPKCDEIEYDPATEFCQEVTLEILPLCGNKKYLYDEFCHNNKVGKGCGNRDQTFDPDLYVCKPEINANGIYLKQKPKDADGNEYEAVLIGDQTWMAENMKYIIDEGSRCHDNDANCENFGRLYNWATAMNGAASSTANPSGVRGICPANWHIPSKAEYEQLNNYVKDNNNNSVDIPLRLKDLGYQKGTDVYGFKALIGGYCASLTSCGGSLTATGGTSRWLTATEHETNSNNAYYWVNNTQALSNSQGQITSTGKTVFYSIRCVKD
jgi:uncharacterized protein (TIGR02145 family)